MENLRATLLDPGHLLGLVEATQGDVEKIFAFAIVEDNYVIGIDLLMDN